MNPSIKYFDIEALGFPCRLAAAEWRPEGAVMGTVVAVHGLSRQKRDFDDLGKYLSAQGYRFLALDAPGRGGSSWLQSAQEYHLGTYAQVFGAFLIQHVSSPVHWIGTSMGGLTALVMGMAGMGDLFRSVTFVDVTHRPNPAACARIAKYMTADLPVFSSVDEYLQVMRSNLPLGQVSDDVWYRYAKHQLVKAPQGYMFHFDPNIVPMAQKGLSSPIDLTPGLVSLSCPVALVAGEISDLCAAQEIADFQSLKPQAPLHRCPGAGHVPALADEATFLFIQRFLKTA